MADTDILARLSAFIDYESPELGEFLYRMWGDEAKAITYKELREAILDGSLSLDYLRDWQQDYSRFINEAYRPCVERAIAQAATDLRTEYGVHFNDPMFSKVDSFIETRGGQLIRQVTTEQYTAINQLVRQATLTNTMTVDQLARSIRPCVGLTRRQAQTTKNFYDSLIEDGYSEKRAHERQLVYAAKVHRRRAALIAQTEMAYAYSAGWHATVQQNVEDGVLPPDTKKVWLTAEDEKVCDVCGAMNGETVLWNEPFSNGSEYPPAHPNCRCHHKIEFVDLLPQAQMHLEEPEREQAQIMADGEEYGIGDDYEETFTEVHAPMEDAPRYTVLEAETQTDGTGSIIELLPEAGATAGAQIPGRGLLSEAGDGMMMAETRQMANSLRAEPRTLTRKEQKAVREAIDKIEADQSRFRFGKHGRTGYDDDTDLINIRGDVFPDPNGNSARDRMSVEAVLAHEYYGHRPNRGTKLPLGSWQDEMRASFTAAVKAPGLTDVDRQLLMRDAIDRAASAGVRLNITNTMRRILYGY